MLLEGLKCGVGLSLCVHTFLKQQHTLTRYVHTCISEVSKFLQELKYVHFIEVHATIITLRPHYHFPLEG